MRISLLRIAATLTTIVAVTAYGATASQSAALIVQPGAPGEPSRVITAEDDVRELARHAKALTTKIWHTT